LAIELTKARFNLPTRKSVDTYAGFADRLNEACDLADIPGGRGRNKALSLRFDVSKEAVRQWFKGQAQVNDLGLRPRHAGPFRGLLLPAQGGPSVGPDQGISADEPQWLNAYLLELAAIRPEQILKRLFRGINRQEDSTSGSGDSGSTGSSVSSDGDSFSSDASDSDGGADSFG